MRQFIPIALICLTVLLVGCGPKTNYDSFVQCISDSGAKMYGAYWCPHCVENKEAFGASKDAIPYVECSKPNRADQTPECIEAGIQSYPTWEFGDGQRIEGAMSMLQLAQRTGCSLSDEELDSMTG
ncbi:MAG: hypothetical protein ABIC95_00095 [archaeon]